MSWAAHQFETYAVQAHLPKKMRGKVWFFGIFLGDFTPDFLAKFWVYGITINGHHYGRRSRTSGTAAGPAWGISHTLFFGALVCLGIWAWKHNRALDDRVPARASPPTCSPTSTTASARCCCSRSRR